MKTSEAIAHFAGIAGILIFMACVAGWVMNIVSLAQASQFSGFVVLRAIGVFVPPLGAVMGYL